MSPGRGATVLATTIHIAVALCCVLGLAYGLTFLEHRIDQSLPMRERTHAFIGISTAYAAEPSAPLLIRSHHMPILVPAGETVTLSLGFKNAGAWAWERGNGSMVALERARPSGPSVFMASDWIDTMRTTFQDEPRVAPGALALFSATFRAPLESGTYTDTFMLRSLDGTAYSGSETEVTMIVTTAATVREAGTLLASSGSLHPHGSVGSAVLGTDGTVDPFAVTEAIRYPEEPTIRIGIEYVEPVDQRWFPHVVSSDRPFRVVQESGDDILTAPANAQIAVDFRPSDGTYHIKHGETWYTSDAPVRFLPTEVGQLLQLPYYTQRLGWEGNTEDNIFRGNLEVRYVPSTERLWAINELGIENYLRGLVETSDNAHPEFHNAQVIAARTFALYHLERGGKYQKGQFILRNDARDQVYRGEHAAQRRPNLVAAVEATRGIVITYEGDVVVTPYFAQDDGRTRGWHETWGGAPRPWLTSVGDPACDGKRLIGHGVGLAQRCAMTLASQGLAWQSILHHYYTGIELRKIYP